MSEWHPLNDFLERCLGFAPDETTPAIGFTADELSELLWPALDVLRVDWPQIATVEYEKRFEEEADGVIILAAEALDFTQWRTASWGARRVIAERVTQTLTLFELNVRVDPRQVLEVLPAALTREQLTHALSLHWLWRGRLITPVRPLSPLPPPPRSAAEPPKRLQ
jgi:hypothetical protein